MGTTHIRTEKKREKKHYLYPQDFQKQNIEGLNPQFEHSNVWEQKILKERKTMRINESLNINRQRIKNQAYTKTGKDQLYNPGTPLAIISYSLATNGWGPHTVI